MAEEEFTSMQVMLAITVMRPHELDSIKDEVKRTGEDFYTKVLMKALNIDEEKVTSAMRAIAKNVLFLYMYGTRGKALMAMLKDKPKAREEDNG